MKPEINWNDRSPEDRARIAQDRSAASYKTPFKGKTVAQRNRLHNAFIAMWPKR